MDIKENERIMIEKITSQTISVAEIISQTTKLKNNTNTTNVTHKRKPTNPGNQERKIPTFLLRVYEVTGPSRRVEPRD